MSPRPAPAPAGPSHLVALLLDGLREGALLADTDGTILHANPVEHRIFGYPPGGLHGLNVSVQNGWPPEENARLVANVIDRLHREGRWEGTWLNRRRDGTVFTSRTRIETVEVEGRTCWLARREDEAEAEARRQSEEEARLAAAAEAGGIGTWDWSPATGELALSDRALAIFGLAPRQRLSVGRLLALVHPDDRARVVERARAALDPRRRDAVPIEYRILRPDGAVRWIHSTGGARFDEGPDGPVAVRYLGALQDVTEQRALAEAESESTRRLRLALGSGRLAVWDLHLPTDTLRPSPELNRLLGFPENHPLRPAEARARYLPGEAERLAAESRAALERGETSIGAEFGVLRADTGELRWLRLRCEILLDAEGRPEKAIGVLSDETDRREAAADLEASEARLQLAAAAAGAGVWEWDLRTGRAHWSGQQYALFGLDPALRDAELHAAWSPLVHPDDLPRTREAMATALAGGRAPAFDYRISRADTGEERWIRSFTEVVQGPDGRAERVVGIEIDVSAEYREAQALRDRAARLEDEVEARRQEMVRFHALSRDLFSITGFDGRFRSVNPAWTQLLGWSEAEILGRHVYDFVHPDDLPRTREAVEGIMAGGSLHGFQNRYLTRDGGTLWIDWTGVPHDGVFYAVGRDVTREREREEILRQSQKMEALGQLTGGIAHDFNNLLQAVQGSLALIRKRPDDPARVAELAEAGWQAARRGGALTSQLLAFSRSRQTELRPIALGALLDELRDLLARSLGPLVDLRLDLPEAPLHARADPTQVELALLNLALNARDALPAGGTITLRLATEARTGDPELPDGDYVRLEVEDQGTGMAPEVARRAFEPFFTTKGLGRGSGLGLSQVYAMARQAGGTARLESAEGRGTTVRLWLPRAEPQAGAEADPVPQAARPAAAARAARILVVDDDPDVRRWLASAIRALGHEVIEAADGPGGLAALDHAPDLAPDVALVDFAMPGMTGAEVAAVLHERRPALPVILATGYADAAALDDAVRPGAQVLRKPFGLDDLEAALARALEGRS